MWQITEDDVESIAIGAGILGTGGGGNPYLGQLRLRTMLRRGFCASIMSLDELPDDALVTEVGAMGAPTVGVEKLPQGDEPRWAVNALEKYTGRTIDAIACAEIGGGNSIEPLVASALTGKPTIDADAMGRAFPEMQMSTHFINGVPCTPAAMVDEKGNQIIFSHMVDPFELERMARHLCITMGCRSMLALPVMTGEQVKRTSVPRTLSLAKRVGAAVREARANKDPTAEAVLVVTGGHRIFTGKLIDVQRRTVGGFARGELLAEGFDLDNNYKLRIAFQNENLVAWRIDVQGNAEVLACVPDLICVLDSETGEPITTEQLRYGLRVTVLAIPCSDMLRTPQALAVVGPAAFGYPEVTFIPLRKTPGQGLE
jgi:uncharacterized protein